MSASQVLASAGIKSFRVTNYEGDRDKEQGKKNLENLGKLTPRGPREEKQDIKVIIEETKAKTKVMEEER